MFLWKRKRTKQNKTKRKQKQDWKKYVGIWRCVGSELNFFFDKNFLICDKFFTQLLCNNYNVFWKPFPLMFHLIQRSSWQISGGCSAIIWVSFIVLWSLLVSFWLKSLWNKNTNKIKKTATTNDSLRQHKHKRTQTEKILLFFFFVFFPKNTLSKNKNKTQQTKEKKIRFYWKSHS